jgi:TRAP-type C4-dicarboxylate transport system permease small subunit
MSPDTDDPLGRWRRLLHRLEDGLLALLLTGMILLAGTQILLRNLFDTGFTWADPLLRILVLWVGLLGALAASRQDKHIAIDVLARALPEGAQRLSHALTALFTAAVCALIAWHSGRFVSMEIDAGTPGFRGLPAWWFELIIPVAFGLIGLRYLLRSLGHARGLLRSRASP